MENIAQFTAEEIHHGQVTLAVPSTGDVTRLQQFINTVRETFAARILIIVGSWRETLITLELDRPIPVATMAKKLVKMVEVEEAQEKKLTKMQGKAGQGILVTLSKSSAVDDYRAGEPMSQDVDILTAPERSESEPVEVA